MVAYIDNCVTKNPTTLSEWVRNFRIKKKQMKRKLRGNRNDLRVNAILSTALQSAEQKLRLKQEERFNRWLDMQSKLESENNGDSTAKTTQHKRTYFSNADLEAVVAAAERERRELEANLWKFELSGLDDFMRSLSSSCNNNNQHHQSQNQRAISIKS